MKYIKLFILIFFICLLSTGCFEDDIEKKQITEGAKEYFSSKYNISKSEIEIGNNNFYGENERC